MALADCLLHDLWLTSELNDRVGGERAYLSRLWFNIAAPPSRTAGDWGEKEEGWGCRQVPQAHREY